MIAFADFFSAAHAADDEPGPPPYPWQQALAHRLATASPPQAVVVPTGGGKTGTVDAFVWALASQASRSPLLRSVGVRTVWAIDRRILVDEVHEHVSQLAARLEAAVTAADDRLHGVARALQSLTDDGSPPLVATRWRGGGIAVDQRALHPFQPEVITSTVAQVGSRLLFRGYGVGRRSLSVQAALCGVDTNICLDEAHLAEPFRQTVEAVVATRARETVALPPLNLVTLTATPGARLQPSQVVSITDADRRLLGRRLTGVKRARLVEPASDRERRGALATAIEEHLDAGAMTVACVVNSVKAAVGLHAVMAKARPEAEHMLLVGPQRPYDRAAALARHHDVLFARARPGKALVLCATQTFEVGLDADVEALVTESASTSALVQRLGRLNRAGERDGAATIVRAESEGLYAREEPEAWTWLRRLEQSDGAIDVSVDALLAEGRPDPLVPPPAPMLTADVLDRLVQTEPRPATLDDPDVDVFLRGAQAEPAADVLVLWRSDLRGEEDGEYREALLRLAPPQRQELVTLSIGRARALLAALRFAPAERARFGARVLDEPDVEGMGIGAELLDSGRPAVAYVILRGDDHLEGQPPLQPGDVVVLPSDAGGYSGQALDLAADRPVDDVALDWCLRREAEAPTFWRLSEEALARLDQRQRRAILRAAAVAANAEPDGRRRALDALGAAIAEAVGMPREELGLAPGAALELRRTTASLDLFADRGWGSEPELLGLDAHDDPPAEEQGVVFEDERRVEHAYVLRVRPSAVELRAPDAPPPTLDAHALAVAARTRRFAAGVALPDAVAATLALAARAHDHGKAEPRTQAFFRGGSAGLGDVVLAKSTFGTADLRADRAARKASGLPAGLRHEVESVAVLGDALAGGTVAAMPPEVDEELLLHLVGTYHGLGRPVPRRPHGGAPPRAYRATAAGIAGTAAGDGVGGWAGGAWLERFLTVTERYGPWGSAYLGALLILADRAVSGEGS